MTVALARLGQVAFPTSDVERSEVFYGTALGLRKMYRYGDLTFFDCAGVRLLLEKVHDPATLVPKGILYFAVADIALARKDLASRGVKFNDEIHLIARMPDHDLWMTFFDDPDGNGLALMMEAPKGYQPPRD
ncbi:MAG TPA: VOC family protein [Reyranella sp.]|nr:VOC family protein [Reyranella sp.]